MDFVTILSGIVIFHAILYFFDYFFKVYYTISYMYILSRFGVEIRFCQIRWFTTYFNRAFQKFGTWKSRVLEQWFTVGVVVTCLLVPPSVLLLCKTVLDYILPRHAAGGDSITLEPVLPGVNLPSGDLLYYLLTLLICSIVHEAGHAVAAVSNNVHLHGCGTILFFILPIAYVDLPTEELAALSPFHKLRVLCAGAWHNIVMAAAAAWTWIMIPLITAPLFTSGVGVYVTKIAEDSPVLGPMGLQVGDHIVRINHCDVNSLNDWYHCLSMTLHHSYGYCTTSEIIREMDESVFHANHLPDNSVQCCEPEHLKNICFEYIAGDDSVVRMQPYTCLPARSVLDQHSTLCNASGDCSDDVYCLKPSLANRTRLLQIDRQGKLYVLYMGHPGELYSTVQVSNYVPKQDAIRFSLPDILETFCKYIISFSSGLAVLNIVPCVVTDGQYITQTLVDILLAKRIENRETRTVIAFLLIIFGTILLFTNVLLGLWNLCS